MSIHDCIQRAIDAKELHPRQGRAAQKHFDQLVKQYQQDLKMHPRQAEAAAAADLKEATRRAARSRFHAVVNQLQAMRRLKAQIEGAPDPALALRAIMEFSETTGWTGESVRSIAEALTGSVNAGIGEFLARTAPTATGRRSRDMPLLLDVIRALHGDKGLPAEAQHLADAIRYQYRRLRQMFNALGGDIGELADYGVPHAHSADQMLKMGFDAWADEIELRLDWSRIDDLATGRPFSTSRDVIPPRAQTDRFLRDVFEGITTRGWDDRAASMATGGAALYNRRADHRVLHFKSGDDWIAYNRRFGASDPFSALVNGLHGLARDVAQMRVLGPNPRAALSYATQLAEKRVAGDARQADRVRKAGKLAATMLAAFDGSASVPYSIGRARFFAGTRAVLVSTNLGSAVLSSVSDMATSAVAAKVVGMNPANVASRTVALIASQATRETAARMGYVAETLADAGAGSARYFGDLFGSGITERLANITLRASGLSFITDMRRLAFQMEFSGYLAENAARDWAGIDPSLRTVLERRGFTAAEWDILRDPAHRFTAPNGADFIAPDWFLEHQTAIPRMEAEGLAMRLRMVMAEQLELAIPTASLEGRSQVLFGTIPGTWGGELLRSTASYKSFALSLMLGQYRRFQSLPTGMAKAQYAASISTLLLLTGALAIQLKELAKGNDPRPMDEVKFWQAALLQGGGLGIFGDFFAAETSRVGKGIEGTAAGPVVGLIGDVIQPVASNAARLMNGQDSLLGRDVAGLMRRYTPVASSHWALRAAYGRIVADNVQALLDPEAEVQWRRAARQQEKDYSTRSWWDRGAVLPDRLPDMTNALGGDR